MSGYCGRLTKEGPFDSVRSAHRHASFSTSSPSLLSTEAGCLSGLLGPTQSLAYRRMEPYGVILLVVLIFTGTVGRVIWPMIVVVEALLL